MTLDGYTAAKGVVVSYTPTALPHPDPGPQVVPVISLCGRLYFRTPLGRRQAVG